jgi:hypothetical protein
MAIIAVVSATIRSQEAVSTLTDRSRGIVSNSSVTLKNGVTPDDAAQCHDYCSSTKPHKYQIEPL